MNPCRSRWMVPSHDRQHGCTIQKNLEILNEKILHTETAVSLRAACSFPNPYLLSLHLLSASTLAPSPISHCNSGRSPVCSVLGLNSWNAQESDEEVTRHRSGTDRNSGNMSPHSEVTPFFAISWIYLRVITAPYLKVATLTRKFVCAMIFYGLQHFERSLWRNSGKCGWMNLIKLPALSHFPLNAIEIRILLSFSVYFTANNVRVSTR